MLSKLDGQRFQFKSKDSGNLTGFRSLAHESLYVKESFPLICIYNVSNTMHNGSRCKFVEALEENSCIVEIAGGKYKLDRKTWSNVDSQGSVVGARSQIPLKLYWASTAHKAQGLELEKVTVHSDYEFTGGLLYTALSRVRRADDLQLIDFDPKHIKSCEKELQEINSINSVDFAGNLSCCIGQIKEFVCSEEAEMFLNGVMILRTTVCETILQMMS